jgi:amidase
VPYLIKDLGFFETGAPATFGSSLFKDFVADHETAYVTRCKKAGVVFIGRSSSPEFGLNPNAEPRLYGSCQNPWNLEYSAGGSSGGSAAAVSAGILPVAHATDGGGSIRIPAAQCGLFGLKPSRGRVSMAPDAGEGWGGLSAGHVVSHSVRDSALMLDCTAGIESGDPYTAPMAERSFLEAVTRPPRKLRIALTLKDHRGAKLHPECLEAVQRAAKLCASLGHQVEEEDPNLDTVALRPMNARISAANTARSCHMRWVDLTPFLPGLSPVQGKAVVARFDGGRLSSEGACWRCAKSSTGWAWRTDWRTAWWTRARRSIVHRLAEIIRFRMLMIAAGYE